MSIHLILGRQGSGKTLLLVKAGYDAYRRGKTVYSNIHLNFPYKHIKKDEIRRCELENGVVLIDEVHILLPARNSMRASSIEIVDGFISMARKRNLEIYGTTQMEEKVDRRFRLEKDYLYLCNRYVYSKKTGWVEVLSSQDFDSKVPIGIKTDIYEIFSGKMISKNFIANPFFSLYNTREIVPIE